MPGPLGCRTTLLAFSWLLPFKGAELTEDGILGTGGIVPLLLLANGLLNRELSPAERRRDGEAMVAYSLMFPFEARELRRGACACNVFMSGMDFLERKAFGAIWLDGVK